MSAQDTGGRAAIFIPFVQSSFLDITWALTSDYCQQSGGPLSGHLSVEDNQDILSPEGLIKKLCSLASSGDSKPRTEWIFHGGINFFKKGSPSFQMNCFRVTDGKSHKKDTFDFQK